MPDHAPGTEAREFAAAFSAFLNWIHESDQESGKRNPVAALVADFLGREAAAHSVVSREPPPFEHVNLETAIDAWSARAGRAVDVQGVLLPQHYRLGLQEIVSAEAVPPVRLTAPALVDLPNGPDSTLGCLKLALLLVSAPRARPRPSSRSSSAASWSPSMTRRGRPAGQPATARHSRVSAGRPITGCRR